MTLRLLISLLLLCIHLCFTSTIRAQEYPFNHYGAAEGLPVDGVYDLLQDKAGYLWIATEGGGVVRFDGKHFDSMDAPENLETANVRCLFEDHKGLIWAGTADHGVFCFDGKTWRMMNNGLPVLHVRSFTEDHKGNLWAATLGGGIALMDSTARDWSVKTIRQWKVLDDPVVLGSSVRCLLRDENKIWMGSDDGLYCYESGAIEKVMLEPQLQDIILCAFKHENTLYFGTENGLIVRDDKGVHRLNHPNINERRIRSIAIDAHGDIWLGTAQGAIQMRLDENKSLQFLNELRKENGLDSDRIRKVLLDRFNTLWFGTYFGGVSQLTGESLLKYSRNSNFPETFITAFEQINDSTNLLGTFEGSIFWVKEGKAERRYQSASKSPENPVIDFVKDGKSVLALVQFDGLLQISEKGDIQVLQASKGEEVACLLYQDEVIIVREREVVSLDGERLLRLGLEDSWRINDAIVHEDQLILMCDDGLRMLNANAKEVELIPKSSGKNISCAAVSPKGSLWFGTKNEGLLKWNGKKLKSFKKSSHLPDLNVHGITSDRDGNLWVSSKQGLSFLELDVEDQFVLNASQVDEGLKGHAAAKSMYVDGNNQLWMGSTRGLYCYQMGGQFNNQCPPQIQLATPRLFFEPIEFENHQQENGKLLLAHNENHLTFDFIGIDLSEGKSIQYQYMLEGLGVNWQNTDQESITFSNIPPGQYQFMLRAQNSDGIWNEQPEVYAFEIRAPFYMRWWFISAVIAMSISLILLVAQLRIASLARQRDFLNKKVKERTADLREAKNKSDELLLNILPKETANELKTKGKALARSYAQASVLFSDFKGFTKMSEQMSSEQLVATLDKIFQRFDALCDLHGIEKIKTIGDAYMCAAGIPIEQEDHAQRLVAFALDMKKVMTELNNELSTQGLPPWNIRIGVHSGALVAGVVGKKKFAYDIWGDTVNIAARMESSGEINQVNVSSETAKLISEDFLIHHRGKIEAKNKGALEMYFVEKRIR